MNANPPDWLEGRARIAWVQLQSRLVQHGVWSDDLAPVVTQAALAIARWCTEFQDALAVEKGQVGAAREIAEFVAARLGQTLPAGLFDRAAPGNDRRH